MTDWESVCRNFSQSKQEATKLYPDSCNKYDAKSVNEIMDLSKRVNALRGKIDNAGTSYNASPDDIGVLQQSMRDFCCAMRIRRDYENNFKEAKQDYEVAKQRVESIRDPPSQLSYMGTYFPFGRPLRPDSVPMLLSFITFFIIMSLGLLLSIGNIQIAYTAPRTFGPTLYERFLDSYQQTSKGILLVTMALSVALGVGIFYGIKKSNPDWLN